LEQVQEKWSDSVRNEDEETGPNRTCVATRNVLPVDDLIRFVLDPAGVLTPDLKGKLPGRGVWVSNARSFLDDAIRRKCFARSLKKPAIVPVDLPGLVERLLVSDVRQSFAMTNKAGLVITGFSKVESAIEHRKVMAILSASDGAADGKRKLIQAITRTYGDPEAIPLVSPLSCDEMDLALGRENAIHAALLAGSASDALLNKCNRLSKFRQLPRIEDRPDAGVKPAFTGQMLLDGQ
jgi:uncharacterized protein